MEDSQREQYALTRLRWNNRIEYNMCIEKQVELNNKVAVIQAIVDDKRETLNEIAEEINYSDSHIKKKSAEIARKINKE